MIDISDIPVIDNHCHYFGLTFPENTLSGLLTLSLENMPDTQLRHSVLYRLMISQLSAFLQCPPEENAVLEARVSAAADSYPGYVAALLDDASLQGLCVDVGLQKSSVSSSEFLNLAGRDVRYVFRIESIVDKLWREQVPVGEALALFRNEVLEAIHSLPAIALKSIIGYRTGLRVDPEISMDKASAMADEKSFRDFFFLEAARICRQESIPFHVHAAFGESNLDLRENNPLHLKPYLDSPLGRELDTVIIHAGYPYTFEAGYLAGMYPRVFIDLSEMIPFAPMGMKRGVEDVFSMCPMNKILYGSDGFDIPETHWLGARMGKNVIGSILNEMIDAGCIDDEYGREIAGMIFHENTRKLHNIQ